MVRRKLIAAISLYFIIVTSTVALELNLSSPDEVSEFLQTNIYDDDRIIEFYQEVGSWERMKNLRTLGLSDEIWSQLYIARTNLVKRLYREVYDEILAETGYRLSDPMQESHFVGTPPSAPKFKGMFSDLDVSMALDPNTNDFLPSLPMQEAVQIRAKRKFEAKLKAYTPDAGTMLDTNIYTTPDMFASEQLGATGRQELDRYEDVLAYMAIRFGVEDNVDLWERYKTELILQAEYNGVADQVREIVAAAENKFAEYQRIMQQARDDAGNTFFPGEDEQALTAHFERRLYDFISEHGDQIVANDASGTALRTEYNKRKSDFEASLREAYFTNAAKTYIVSWRNKSETEKQIFLADGDNVRRMRADQARFMLHYLHNPEGDHGVNLKFKLQKLAKYEQRALNVMRDAGRQLNIMAPFDQAETFDLFSKMKGKSTPEEAWVTWRRYVYNDQQNNPDLDSLLNPEDIPRADTAAIELALAYIGHIETKLFNIATEVPAFDGVQVADITDEFTDDDQFNQPEVDPGSEDDLFAGTDDSGGETYTEPSDDLFDDESGSETQTAVDDTDYGVDDRFDDARNGDSETHAGGTESQCDDLFGDTDYGVDCVDYQNQSTDEDLFAGSADAGSEDLFDTDSGTQLDTGDDTGSDNLFDTDPSRPADAGSGAGVSTVAGTQPPKTRDPIQDQWELARGDTCQLLHHGRPVAADREEEIVRLVRQQSDLKLIWPKEPHPVIENRDLVHYGEEIEFDIKRRLIPSQFDGYDKATLMKFENLGWHYVDYLLNRQTQKLFFVERWPDGNSDLTLHNDKNSPVVEQIKNQFLARMRGNPEWAKKPLFVRVDQISGTEPLFGFSFTLFVDGKPVSLSNDGKTEHTILHEYGPAGRAIVVEGPYDLSNNVVGKNRRFRRLVSEDFNNAHLNSTDFSHSDMTCASLQGAYLHDANLYKINLTDADLLNATGANYLFAQLCRTRLPEGNIENRDCGNIQESEVELIVSAEASVDVDVAIDQTPAHDPIFLPCSGYSTVYSRPASNAETFELMVHNRRQNETRYLWYYSLDENGAIIPSSEQTAGRYHKASSVADRTVFAIFDEQQETTEPDLSACVTLGVASAVHARELFIGPSTAAERQFRTARLVEAAQQSTRADNPVYLSCGQIGNIYNVPAGSQPRARVRPPSNPDVKWYSIDQNGRLDRDLTYEGANSMVSGEVFAIFDGPKDDLSKCLTLAVASMDHRNEFNVDTLVSHQKAVEHSNQIKAEALQAFQYNTPGKRGLPVIDCQYLGQVLGEPYDPDVRYGKRIGFLDSRAVRIRNPRPEDLYLFRIDPAGEVVVGSKERIPKANEKFSDLWHTWPAGSAFAIFWGDTAEPENCHSLGQVWSRDGGTAWFPDWE